MREAASTAAEMPSPSKNDRLECWGGQLVIYEHSLAIGQRFGAILDLLRTSQHSTRTLAVALGVSEPTISRCLAALRRRGYRIEPRRREQGWSYALVHEPNGVAATEQPRGSGGIEVEHEVG